MVISLESAAGLPNLGRGKNEGPQADRAHEDSIVTTRWSGYLIVNDELRPLPVGSTLDSRRAVFYWQPGPGFLGTYRFVFVDGRDGKKKFVTLSVRPKSFLQRR